MTIHDILLNCGNVTPRNTHIYYKIWYDYKAV